MVEIEFISNNFKVTYLKMDIYPNMFSLFNRLVRAGMPLAKIIRLIGLKRIQLYDNF